MTEHMPDDRCKQCKSEFKLDGFLVVTSDATFCCYPCFQHWAFSEIQRLTDEHQKLIEAVKALPVEELNGGSSREPELLGYVMQAQGEWVEVMQLIAASEAQGE